MQVKRNIIGAIVALFVVFIITFTSQISASNNKHHYIDPISFAVIGDGPYGDDKEEAYDRMITSINNDHEVSFVIHVGDIKSGGAECTNERLQRRFEQLQQIQTALIYTPGDNEWTDCHRESNGGWHPLERLSLIRQLFFPNPGMTTGQNPRSVRTQANIPDFEKYVENSLLVKGHVVISTIHVVGSNNNLRPWSGIDPADSFDNPRKDRINEFNERNAASLNWLEHTFQLAHEQNTKGIFIAIHADPNFDLPSEDIDRTGFNPFLEKLFALTQEYNRPVVLSHGDSHVFRVDRPRFVPWYSNPDATNAEDNLQIPKLTRLEVFGDSEVHWVKVRVNPYSPEVFSFTPQLVPGNLPPSDF
jgi:calcineurin-like phosphoesterase family protein